MGLSHRPCAQTPTVVVTTRNRSCGRRSDAGRLHPGDIALLIGFGATPARAARWPAAAQVLEEQGDVLVTSGLAILAASGALLLVFLIIPALA